MAHFKKFPQNKHEGKIVYQEGIVDGIAMLAVSELENVELSAKTHRSSMRSGAINVTFDKDGVHIDVSVKIQYTQNVSEMAFKIQEIIRYNVESMTEYKVASVNVIVNGVIFDEIPAPVNNTQENQ